MLFTYGPCSLGARVCLAKVLPNGARSTPEAALRALSGIVGVDVHLVLEGKADRPGFAVGVGVVLLLGNALLLATLLHMDLSKIYYFSIHLTRSARKPYLESLLVSHERVAEPTEPPLVVLGVVKPYPVLPQLHLVVELLRALLARIVRDLGVLAGDVLLELGPVARHLAERARRPPVHVAEVRVHARPVARGRGEVAVLVRAEDLRGVGGVALVLIPPPPFRLSLPTVVLFNTVLPNYQENNKYCKLQSRF